MDSTQYSGFNKNIKKVNVVYIMLYVYIFQNTESDVFIYWQLNKFQNTDWIVI